MSETKLTVRVPRDLLENVKRYAAKNNTTLTDLLKHIFVIFLHKSPLTMPLLCSG